jgi:TM2 domain-containing membrane protein YozV
VFIEIFPTICNLEHSLIKFALSKSLTKSIFMKKVVLLFSLMLLIGATSFGNVSQYKVDDTQIEAMFAQAEQVSLPSMLDSQGFEGFAPSPEAIVKKSSKNAWVAFALAFVVGQLGIHRAYLGTKPMTWIGYILTCGGIFGIVPFVDWIVLLIGAIEQDISQYIDNPAFFMWM